jgi:serine/threonine-protein kinase HipA
MRRCLYCYRPLTGNEEEDFHVSCARKMFDQPVPPAMPWSETDLEALAMEVVQSRTALTGVQPKLSLHISGRNKENKERRFTIVGLWGGYVLKPPTALYPQLPEVEDLTMHLAGLAGIRTAPHCLIRLKPGSLAYLTKRMDRTRKDKLAMEDMCQLTGRLTEDKYHGSYEQIARAILRYSATPGLDVVNFFELLLFSFLTGNADMHLKNFSLLDQPGLGMTLSPAYDLVNTVLVNPADDEELALTLNGKKNRLIKPDFVKAMDNSHLAARQQENIFKKMENAIPQWTAQIDISFLDKGSREQYKTLIDNRARRVL